MSVKRSELLKWSERNTEGLALIFFSLQYFNCCWWVLTWSKNSFLGPAVISSFVFQVLFQDELRMVSPRFRLFVPDIKQWKEEAR